MRKALPFLISALILLPMQIFADNTSLQKAIGQMMMVGFKGTTIAPHSPIVQTIKKYHIGGVILFRTENIKGKRVTRNITGPKQLQQLVQSLQKYTKQYGDAPLFISTNQEGGKINNLLAQDGFELGADFSEQQLGKTKSLTLIEQQAYHRGKLLKQYGINLDLAPVADLNINPNNPAIGKVGRSFGRNPNEVTKDLRATVVGYHKAGVFCTFKHFPGFGSANHNTDFAAANLTKTWRPEELIPYRRLIASNQACDFVMVAHSINRKLAPSGRQTSLSKKVVTDLLRKTLRYKGIIMTDDMDAAAIRKHVPTRKAIKLAILAGNNIILYGGTFEHTPAQDAKMLFDTIKSLAEHNTLIRAKVMASYQRIMRLKNQHVDLKPSN